MSIIPIIVFSLNRHHYLDRILTYYRRKQYEHHLIIVDGSEEKWPGAADSSLMYLHLPGLSFRERVLSGINKTQSDYVVLCADDDFVVPVGIEACEKFLRKNPDYSCAQGLYGRFVISNNQVSYSQKGPELQSIIDDDSLDRIKKAFIPKYIPHVYAVHRRENLEKVLSLTEFADEEYLWVFEELLTFITCISGKCKRIPVIYNFREMENEKGYINHKYAMIERALLGLKEAATGFIPEEKQTYNFTQTIDRIANIQKKVYFSVAFGGDPSPKKYASLHKLFWRRMTGFRSFNRVIMGRIKALLGRTNETVGKNAFPLRPYSDRAFEEFLIIDTVIKNWMENVTNQSRK